VTLLRLWGIPMTYDKVIFKGEEYLIVGEAMAEVFDENDRVIFVPVVLITKIERAGYRNFQGAIWTPLKNVWSLPSNIDASGSDWTLGINLGNLYGKKGDLDTHNI
jgi:hypothetical protein